MNRTQAKKRLYLELWAFRRVFKFTPQNNDMEKMLMGFMLSVWSLIAVGIAFGHAEHTETFTMLTALVWAIVGRVWGGEVKDVTSG